MDQEFDLVMFNHSFEHMPDPLATLGKAYELVKPGHFLLSGSLLLAHTPGGSMESIGWLWNAAALLFTHA